MQRNLQRGRQFSIGQGGTVLHGNAVDIIDKDGAGANKNYSLVIDNNVHCGGLAWRVGFDTSGAASEGACYVTTINTGTWYLVTGTWDGTTLALYVNGAPVATNVPGAVPATGSGNPLNLGNEFGQSVFFNGTLDDARVYNVALSAAQVAALYNSASSTYHGEGDMMYNSTYNVMQYCNGTNFVRVGKHVP